MTDEPERTAAPKRTKRPRWKRVGRLVARSGKAGTKTSAIVAALAPHLAGLLLHVIPHVPHLFIPLLGRKKAPDDDEGKGP
ncbi:MAG: hypothetical protein IT371_10185 [Deltaproteobacteria bacterium]|nr:hypothetical protein [Deltaproteobacteria bacterium]